MGEEGTTGCMVGVDGGNEEKEQDQMSKSIRARFVRGEEEERGMEELFLSKGEQLSVTTEMKGLLARPPARFLPKGKGKILVLDRHSQSASQPASPTFGHSV